MDVDSYSKSLDGFLQHEQQQQQQLPGDLLSLLPADPLSQLELAHRIACHAYSHQVSHLEGEAQQMRATISQNQQHIKQLERRMAGMEAEVHEHQQRARQCMAEQHKLVAEKNALIETVKRLNREVARLEHFKRNLLQQLQDEEQPEGAGGYAPSLAAIDLTTERLVSEVLHSADGIAAAAAAAAAASAAVAGGVGPAGAAAHQAGGRLSPPSSRPGALEGGRLAAGAPSPSGRPYGAAAAIPFKAGSKAAAGEGPHAASVGSPYGHARSPPPSLPAAAAASAAAAQLGAAGGRYCSTPGAGRGSAPGAAPGGRVATAMSGGGGGGGGGAGAGAAPPMSASRIDGKEFFRQARARLSYEQFSHFLAAIKDLNAGRANREDTLASAQQLFGPSNGDLYGLFEGLLMRHLTSL